MISMKLSLFLVLATFGCSTERFSTEQYPEYTIKFMDQWEKITVKSSGSNQRTILLVPTTLFEQKTFDCFYKIDPGRVEFDFSSIFDHAFEICSSKRYYNSFFQFSSYAIYTNIAENIDHPKNSTIKYVDLKYLLKAKENDRETIVCLYNDIYNKSIDINFNFDIKNCLEQFYAR